MGELKIEVVVGLGNPGEKYAGTFHNAGFMAVQRLAGADARWKGWKGVALAVWDKPALFLPQTFMNLSGRVVKVLADYRKLKPEQILVVCDDLALGLGEIRVRRKGSSGGQKGLASIIDSLGSDSFPRARIGIGPLGSGRDAAQYVLKTLRGDVKKNFLEVIARAAEVVRFTVEKGVEEAMNRFNSKDFLA